MDGIYFLFARPSFWSGFGRVLDLGNTMFIYNNSATPEQADYFATKSDWMTIGDDFVAAFEEAASPEIEAAATP